MTFDGDRLDTGELQVRTELYFAIVDLQGHKDTLEILTGSIAVSRQKTKSNMGSRVARPDQ